MRAHVKDRRTVGTVNAALRNADGIIRCQIDPQCKIEETQKLYSAESSDALNRLLSRNVLAS